MTGRTLLHYTIASRLGAGAMGEVYLARDERTERHVALKFVRTATAADPEARERLIREARAVARLSHPGIVTLYGVEMSGDEIFLVQEYVDGDTLAARLTQGVLTAHEAVRLARELTAALAHAHAQGVLHRDLKPENVLVSPDGRFKIADFGIARVEGTPSLTATHGLLGTLPYMAPERLRGAAGDERADLFALGAILYEAVAGRRAFPGATEGDVLYAVLEAEPEPLATGGATARLLSDLAVRLMAKDPQARPASAEVVLGILDGMETTRRLVLPRRPRPWLVPALAGALLVVALAGASLWRRGRLLPEAQGASPALAVLTFENVADPPDRERLGPIAGSLLVSSLAQSPELNVLSTGTILDAMRAVVKTGQPIDRAAAFATARRAHARQVVMGSILQVVPNIVLTAEMADVSTGRVIGAERVEGQAGETVFQVVDALGARLLAKLAHTTPPVTGVPRGRGDIDAYRAYVEGLDALSRGNLRGASQGFGAAVEKDSTFAQAHLQLAITRWWSEQAPAARSSIRMATRYTARLTPIEQQMLAGLTPLVDMRFRDAEAFFGRLAGRYPEDKLIQYGQVEAAFHAGKPEEAIVAARRAIAIDPTFQLPYVHLVDGLLVLGRTAEAEQVAREAVRVHPQNPLLWMTAMQTAERALDVKRALSIARQAEAAGAADLVRHEAGQLCVALDSLEAARHWLVAPIDSPAWRASDARAGLAYKFALREGRFGEALALARHAWATYPVDAAPPASFTPMANGFPAGIRTGNVAQTLAWSDSFATRYVRRAGPEATFMARIDRVSVEIELGLLDRAAADLRALSARPEARRDMNADQLHLVRAMLLAAQNRHGDALGEYARVSRYVRGVGSTNTLRVLRAKSQLALGLNREAAASLDTAIAVPLIRLDCYAPLFLYRAKAREALGQSADAIADYREVLRVWQRADPRRPEIREAQAALRRLRAVS